MSVYNLDRNRHSSLVKNIECCICLCPFFQAVTLHPCNHTLCKTCYIKITLTKSECPQCKRHVIYCGDNHNIQNIVREVIQLHPELSRSQQEMERLDEYTKDNIFQQKYIEMINLVMSRHFRQQNLYSIYTYNILINDIRAAVRIDRYRFWLDFIYKCSIVCLCLYYYCFVIYCIYYL
mgnify:CR=1 FL=1